MRIDRLLSIIILLLNRDRMSARELADRFEVSIRTIYRDIDAINLSGIPIISFPGINGGFGIMENYTIDRQVLTLNDIMTILSALKGIHTTFDDRTMENAIEKITSLLPQETSKQLEKEQEQVIFDIMPYGYTAERRHLLKKLYKAVSGNQLIEFDYRNLKGEAGRRITEPMTLLLKGSAWYLFAYCLWKKECRLFKLSRIRKLTLLNKIFIRRKISYKDHRMFATPKNLVSIHLKFFPNARLRVEEYFESHQLEYKTGGSIHAHITYPLDEWVYSFILSYGEDVEVISPPYVREKMKEKVKKINSFYNPDIQVSQ